MEIQLDGTTVSAIFIGVATLLTYLVSQMSAKAREDRRQLRRLTKRELAWTRWERAVKLWAARLGHDDLPETPEVLVESEDEL